jgi:hypothetical protein
MSDIIEHKECVKMISVAMGIIEYGNNFVKNNMGLFGGD